MLKKKLTYRDLESRINDLEFKLEKFENNQFKLETPNSNQEEESQYLQEQEFRALVENAPDIIFRFDKALRHTYVNTAIEKATGIPKQAFIGKDHRDLGMPEDIVLFFQKHIRKVFESGQNIEFSFIFPTPTGKLHYESRYVPEFAKDGTVKYVIGISRDVTEHNRILKSLQKSESQLRDLNTTKDKFFSIIAHDLRGPLSGITKISDVLANENMEKFDPLRIKEIFKEIHELSKNTFDLLENLLEWSKIQTKTKEFNPIKINSQDLIKMAMTSVELFASKKNIQLSLVTDKDFDIHADVNMISTVIRNLLSNAVKFTPEGGSVKINLAERLNEKNENFIEIIISDTGIGIEPEIIKELFKIEENKPSLGTAGEKGSGLGLILCKEFVEKHGGKIWVESEVGKGSKFIFSTPLYNDKRLN